MTSDRITTVRRMINEGLKDKGLEDKMTGREWAFLQGSELFGEMFNDETDVEEVEVDVESAIGIIELLRKYYPHPEPGKSDAEREETSSPASDRSAGLVIPDTPSDQVYAAIAAYHASQWPLIESYREQYLRGGLIAEDGIPEFLRQHSERIFEGWIMRYEGERPGVHDDSIEYPVALPYAGFLYLGYEEGAMADTERALKFLEQRYRWNEDTSLRFLLCGTKPGLRRTVSASRMHIRLEFPEFATRDEVSLLLEQARSKLFRKPPVRFSQKSGRAVVFAVERLMQGDTLADAARAWSDDPAKQPAFRREYYRALNDVWPSFNSPPPPVPMPRRRRRSDRSKEKPGGAAESGNLPAPPSPGKRSPGGRRPHAA